MIRCSAGAYELVYANKERPAVANLVLVASDKPGIAGTRQYKNFKRKPKKWEKRYVQLAAYKAEHGESATATYFKWLECLGAPRDPCSG